ncbi:hypothetical protein [Nannocystis pusilla]|uniref:hypothetical protein n=1 Tax=Nannocystis pusilla TaxID=889268 RepID=UPI003B7A1451
MVVLAREERRQAGVLRRHPGEALSERGTTGEPGLAREALHPHARRILADLDLLLGSDVADERFGQLADVAVGAERESAWGSSTR